MDWGQFGTIIVQIIIVTILVAVVGFFGSALVYGIIERIKKGKS